MCKNNNKQFITQKDKELFVFSGSYRDISETKKNKRCILTQLLMMMMVRVAKQNAVAVAVARDAQSRVAIRSLSLSGTDIYASLYSQISRRTRYNL